MNSLAAVAGIYSTTSPKERNKLVYTGFEAAAKADLQLSTSFAECDGFGELAFAWNWKLLVDAIPTKEFSMLEVGVYKGRVLAQVGMCARRVGKVPRLYGVTPLCDLGDKYSRYDVSNYFGDIQTNFSKCQVPIETLQLFIGLSQDSDILQQVSKVAPYDIIFIDGCHDYEVVLQDIEGYIPFLRVGGYFVMDDCSLYLEAPYGQFLGHPDVSRAAEERLRNHPQLRHMVAVGHNQVWQKIA
jgi:hypothetical protein